MVRDASEHNSVFRRKPCLDRVEVGSTLGSIKSDSFGLSIVFFDDFLGLPGDGVDHSMAPGRAGRTFTFVAGHVDGTVQLEQGLTRQQEGKGM